MGNFQPDAMQAMPTLLVAGASGLIGRAAVAHFASRPAWRVIGLARRALDAAGNRGHMALDLLDRVALEAAGAGLRDVTHVLFAALHERPELVRGWRDRAQMQTNLDMLVNLIDVLQRHAPGLAHITLLQGTKAYGVHLHPIQVPAREQMPRDTHPNFYWLQEDWLRQQQQGKAWS